MKLNALREQLGRADVETLSSGWVDTRLISAIRWLIATTALIHIMLDPKQPDRHVNLTYALLVLYTLYSSTLYFLSMRRSPLFTFVKTWSHWIDVAWFTLLIAMCSGTNRIFFFGFIFTTLVASFRRGFAAGLSVVIVSTLSYTIVGYTTETASPGFDYGFDVYRFFLRPVYLAVLGYMMAYWGGREIELKRRLALLKDTTLSNPRFGVDRTINSMIERLRDYYDADAGLLITTDLRTSGHLLYRAQRREAQATARPEAISPELARRLLGIPPSLAVGYNRGRGWWRRLFNNYYAFDVLKDERAGAGQPESEALANTLDAAAYITVPIFRHQEINGRLYLSMKRRRTFDSSDVEFLLQVVEHVSPIIENIRLVDRLASDAAEQERQRIARDIHDSVIQPYIGFQMGLNGMRRKLSTGQVDLSTEIERLLEMTTVGIADLRRYVGGLKDAGARELSLLPMVRRFVRKFDEATGIEVRVEAPHEISMNDRLAAEVFQMVAEGLSNIRRHTEAARALIGIECDERKFILRIENDRPPHVALPPFTPRSLGERAASLNGCLLVENPDAGGTIVRIEIPL